MSQIDKYSEKTFEDIKHFTEDGTEFWYARELQEVLEYTEWRNFSKVISDHFVDVNKMVQLGSGAEREIKDVMLSRYACYLIVQNSDPRKEVVALGQTYFAVKTRERELEENFNELTEEQKRLAIRNELKTHNKSLAEAAQMAGVRTGMDYCYFSK
jgi:DNA-damage-inducible protein D